MQNFPKIPQDCMHTKPRLQALNNGSKDRRYKKEGPDLYKGSTQLQIEINIEQKKQGWFYSREYTCIFFVTNISKGTAFLHQGLTDNDKVMLRQYDTIITREKLNKKKSNVKSTVNSLVSDRPWCPTKWSLTGGGRLREK